MLKHSSTPCSCVVPPCSSTALVIRILKGDLVVQKTCRWGTSGHDLTGMVVLGWWLDLTTLEVFSNLKDVALQDMV